MRKPLVNLVLIAIISAFYAFVFVISSGHAEYEHILDHSMTLNNTFWNAWTVFLKQGKLKYIGYAFIVLTAAIIIISVIKRQHCGDCQTAIFEKGIIVSGIALTLLLPLTFLLILSDHGYAVEFITFLAVSHWSVLLFADLIYVIKQGKA